jgi:putative restriction endonuclease
VQQSAVRRLPDHEFEAIVAAGLPALSGTLHWMFDRGLLSVADDHSILVSRNKVPHEVVDRLIVPDGKMCLPADWRDHPHPENLRWHRENVFGQVSVDEPMPWG